MRGNKISIIFVLFLLFCELLLVQRSFAQTPASALQANPLSINYAYPNHGPGEEFSVYVDVVNVTNLFSFRTGFYFDKNALQVMSVGEGGFLSNNGSDTLLSSPGTIDNANGVVAAYGWSLTDTTKAKTGSGHLIKVQMKVNSALWPPYSGTFPGSPVDDMNLTVTADDPVQTILLDTTGYDVTPAANNLYSGTFTLSVVPHAPTASFTISPIPPHYAGNLLTFDGSASMPGWNGYTNAPIVSYTWNFGDGNTTTIATPTLTHIYPTAGSYYANLTVTDANALDNSVTHLVTVIVEPTGHVLDVLTQKWRYIDPFYYNVTQGKGANLPADMFRPGDYVELFVTTVYNGDPVADQLVAYEIFGNESNWIVHFTSQAVTNTYGLGEFDFRIPWPTTGVTDEFGTWKVIVTWEVNSKIPPYHSITQNDTLTFNVGWGLWSSDFKTDLASYHKGDLVTVTHNLHNDYGIAINALNTVTLYDDLGGRIGGVYMVATYSPNSVTPVSVQIQITKWAFFGGGTAKGDEFTTWPRLNGIATGPEQLASFGILQTFNPADP